MTARLAPNPTLVPTFAPTLALPTSLAFVAGFVDACTFLAFAGFFVAQATGSFVVAGSEIMSDDAGFAIKVAAFPVFILAGMLTTFMVRSTGDARRALTATLCVEAALLVGLTASGLASAGHAAGAPALFGLAAMGVQSAAGRLLLSDFASSNVMTTNTSQLSVYLADSIMNRRLAPKLWRTGSIMLGFLAGVAAGGVAFKAFGLICVLFAVAALLCIIAALALRAFDGDASA